MQHYKIAIECIISQEN